MLPLLLAAVVLTGFNQTPVLEPAASAVAGVPAHVMCPSTAADWEAGENAEGWSGQNVWGFTNFSEGRIYLHPNGCRILKALVRNKAIAAPLTLKAGFALTLVHESIHVGGIRDEGVTECNAIHQLPRILVRYFHVKSGKQLRAWMAAAWTVHRTDPPPYQSVC